MEFIHLLGNLTADAALRSTVRNGVKSEFVSFKMACNYRSGDQTVTTYYDVTAAKTGVFEYLKKGRSVAVAGRLHFAMTPDEKGAKWPHLNVSAVMVELPPSGGKKGDLPEP